MIPVYVIPEMPSNAPRPQAYRHGSLSDPILATRSRARRRWAARTAVLLVVSGIALILMVLWRRDVTTKNSWLRSAERSATAIQAHFDETGLLPAALPEASLKYQYASYYDRFYAERVSRPVIIAISPVVSLNLLPDGRSVIIFENGKLRSAWMTTGKFHHVYMAQIRDQDRFEQERRAQLPQLP